MDPTGQTARAPRAEGGPEASSNMTDFRLCELQNRRRKCRSFVQIMMWSQKKKVFTEIFPVFPVEIRWSQKKTKTKVFRPHMLITQCHFDGPLSNSWARWIVVEPLPEAHGPPKVNGTRGHCIPLPPFGGPVERATHLQFRDRTNSWTNQVHLWNRKTFKN